MFVNMRNKVHATCKYWKNRRCHKSAAKCNFVHAYICQNDGRCHYDKCTHLHFKQEAPYIRNKWGFGGRRNFRFGGGRGGRNRRRSRSRSRSLSYGRGRSRSRSRSRGRSFRSFSRSRSRSLRGGSREGSFDRSYDRLHRSRSRGRMSRSMSRGRLSRSRSRSRHMSLDRLSRSGSRGRGRSRNRRSMSMGRSGSPSPLRERGMHNRSQSRGRSWSRSRSRSGSRGRLSRSRSGSRPRMGRSGMRRRGRSRSGSRPRIGRSRSGSRGRGGRSRSGSRGRLGRSRSGSGGRRGRSRSGSRSRVSRSASRERNDSRGGRSRSGSGSRGDDRSRSGSRSRRRDSRSGSRSRHWSRSQSARSRSPSAGGGERFSHKSPDDRRDSPEGAGGISEATKSSYAAFATAYPSSSSYASDPNAYPSSYQNPSSFTPSSGFSGDHPYPPMTYSTAYPSTSTSYSTNTYENSQENPTYSSQFNETTYPSQPANQAANSPGSSSSHHNSDDSDGLEIGKGDETILGLEEVGDEVDDTYGSSMIRSVEESISDALMQGIQRGKRLREVQKEVSSKNLTDWELKCVLENPSKSIETMPPPGAQDPQLSGELARRNEMWTPTLDRRSVTEAKQKMSRRANDWEIETPYITRSSKASSGGQGVGRDVSKVVDTVAGLKMDMKLSSQQKGAKTLFPSAVLEADTLSSVAQSYSSLDEGSKRMPPPKEFAVPDIPSSSTSSKKTEGSDSTKEEKKSQSKRGGEESSSSSSKKSSKEKKEKKKKKKRRKRTSSSDSEIASDTDDSEIDKKKEAQERAKKEAKERIKLLEKKDELLNKVHLLVVEREKLERQREEIVQNHKGDSKSLKSILEDNSGLMKEIHKQIFSMDEMISKVNSALGIADQGQEKPRDLLGKGKSPPQPPPPPSMPRHSSSTPPVVRKVESTVDNETYGPLPALKTSKDISPLKTVQVKYVDQGMHWCKLCGIFCNNLTGYIEHLESPSHVESTKMEKKTWLAKAARPEKERIAPNAQTITEPLQGSEFLHSILVFYCSLCDSFLRDKKEAIHHPESKLHVSMYKNHLANNSMYEASYMKAKMGAYATFKINQEKQKRESLESLEREKGLKKEAREKDLAEMRHKGLKEGELGKDAKDRDREANTGDDGREYGSIRVASRGPSRKRDREEDDRRWEDREDRRWEERDRRKKDYEWREERGRREYEDRKGYDRRKQDRGRGEQSSHNDTPSPRHAQYTESKRESSSTGKNSESDRNSEKNDEIEKEPRDENRLTPTTSTKPKLPLIGKMPFFKKKGSSHPLKEKMDKLYDLDLDGKGVKQEMEEDMDIDEKYQISEAFSPVSAESDVKLEAEKPVRKSEDKLIRRLEEEKPVRKLEEEKPIKKLEEEKPVRKLEEEKPIRKLEEEKPIRKLEEEKPIRKLEEGKLIRKLEEKSIRKLEEEKFFKKLEEEKSIRKLEEEKYINLFDPQVSDILEDEKHERKGCQEAPVKSIPLPPVLGCADERDAEACGENAKYSPTKAEVEEIRPEKEEIEFKVNSDIGSDSSSSFFGQEISFEDRNKKVEEEEAAKEEEQHEESQQNQHTRKKGKGRGRGRPRGRGRGKGKGKSKTSTEVEEKEVKSEGEQEGGEEEQCEEEQGDREEQGGRGEEQERREEQGWRGEEQGGREEEEGGGGTGSEVEGDVEHGENEGASRSGRVKSRSERGAQAAKHAMLKEVPTPTRRSRRQAARLAAKEEERELELELEQEEQEQEEGHASLETVEEDASEIYTNVMPSDLEESTQDDGSAFYQPEEITMTSLDIGMEDHSAGMDMNSVSLHAEPLNSSGIGPCAMVPATSVSMAMDSAATTFPVVHHIGATESSSAVPEDPLFPPGTEPSMMVEQEKDDLDEVPMDTEEEPQEPYIGDISDTLKHIGQSDHFDKLEEMKLLGIDIDDVAATSSME